MTGTPPSGWEDILRPGETILWQGQPGQDLHLSSKPMQILMGLVIAGFALFWIFATLTTGEDPGPMRLVLPLFGLIFVYQGLGMAGGFALWDAYKRRRTWYTLTDLRAFIRREVLGRTSLEQHEVADFAPVETEFGPHASVWFTHRPGRRGKRGRIGFYDIDDAHKVRDIIRELQKDQSA